MSQFWVCYRHMMGVITETYIFLVSLLLKNHRNFTCLRRIKYRLFGKTKTRISQACLPSDSMQMISFWNDHIHEKLSVHDVAIKHFPLYWLFVRGSHRWLMHSLTKASNAELWSFLWSAPEQTVEKTMRSRWFETPSRSFWRHRNKNFMRSWAPGRVRWVLFR